MSCIMYLCAAAVSPHVVSVSLINHHRSRKLNTSPLRFLLLHEFHCVVELCMEEVEIVYLYLESYHIKLCYWILARPMPSSEYEDSCMCCVLFIVEVCILCSHVRVCVCVCVCARARVHVCVCVCVCILIRIAVENCLAQHI